MKNLKLFVAPLLGAALLTACGPKSMDVKAFKEKVEENFKLETVKAYKGKKQVVTGSMPIIGEINDTLEIEDAAPLDVQGTIYYFVYKDGKKASYADYDILSPEVVDKFEIVKSTGATVNYFISGGTYTIEGKMEEAGTSVSEKYVFNKDFAITHYEMKMSGGVSMQGNINFKYE